MEYHSYSFGKNHWLLEPDLKAIVRKGVVCSMFLNHAPYYDWALNDREVWWPVNI